MTVHLLVSDPPENGQLGTALDDATDLDTEAIESLARAMLKDAVDGVEGSGGGLVVGDTRAAESPLSRPPKELTELIAPVTEEFELAQFDLPAEATPGEFAEVGVSTLLQRDDATTVALLDGRAPTVDRSALDSAAMKLRRSEVVLGPAPGGRVAYLGLSEPLELGELPWPLTLQSVVAQANEAGYTVDFLPLHPWVGSPRDLLTLVSVISARRQAGKRVPEFTAAAISTLGLSVSDGADGPILQRAPTDRD